MKLSLFALLALVSCAPANEASRCTARYTETRPDMYWIKWDSDDQAPMIREPLGRLALVRARSGRVFSVRFTNARAAPADEFCGCAHYEVHEIGDGKPRMVCSGEASDFTLRNLNHPVLWTVKHFSSTKWIEQQAIPCLPGEAMYMFPGTVGLRFKADVAVSGWTSPQEVDLRSPSLHWYTFASDGENGVDLTTADVPK